MNQATVAGHLGSDPEVKFTPSGRKVTTLRVAARTRKAGKDETIWWRVTIWGEQFDKMMAYFKKGSPIIVQGEMDLEIFTNREGKPQISAGITAHNIMFSPFGRTDQRADERQTTDAPLKEEGIQAKPLLSNEPFDAEEEIPF
ncbi:Single-stranded DNA-binding protein [Candidatus Rhabdochlamydia oedothoracis]|uniref:Single-stranded DNA-binding protein n=1 Tax=Candidatus Rhabdochlamydia oedothoracis TaxID=2720720 RepID=A0ABX8V1A1_9BACT|nr:MULTISPECIES: single-stranded DNA-binding protein [Rhabdochlamydia]KAG6559774.1 Single-stranded DNA-binding protein [Candidatus Rhabdochlamydia sp. W815]MCL6755883.1 single-stranded DNA-binding protein [Candidatus Rhabdochlamydia oedothoracis]QYF49003.1 Single-stranded DNA-binding protein [Candidatus Rhabdochlamydia oedothoracis]